MKTDPDLGARPGLLSGLWTHNGQHHQTTRRETRPTSHHSQSLLGAGSQWGRRWSRSRILDAASCASRRLLRQLTCCVPTSGDDLAPVTRVTGRPTCGADEWLPTFPRTWAYRRASPDTQPRFRGEQPDEYRLSVGSRLPGTGYPRGWGRVATPLLRSSCPRRWAPAPG
jgi:hypothetical protein